MNLEQVLSTGLPPDLKHDPLHLLSLDLWIDEDGSAWSVDLLEDGTCITWCVSKSWQVSNFNEVMFQHSRDCP